MIAKVKETIRRYSLLTPGDRVVVAVSGGPDSVCLLHVLLDLSREFRLFLHVAHLDHMFRGEESAEEARFVRDLAGKLHLPAAVGQTDVPRLCRQRGLSAQTGAREARYAFLRRVAEETQATRMATGHTASDQAETFLLRLIRGAGLSGLSGIPPVRGDIIRPLIEVTREEVLRYLASKSIPFVTDPSNSKTVYARNRIRHELLPVLARFNPRITETLATEASLLRDEDDAAEACLEQSAAGMPEPGDGGSSLDREVFLRMPAALQRRVLRRAVAVAGSEPSSVSSIRLEEARMFLMNAQTGRAMELLAGLRILREYDRFLLQEQQETAACAAALPVPGTAQVPNLGIEIETRIFDKKGDLAAWKTLAGGAVPGQVQGENYIWQALFDYAKIGGTIEARNRRPGDRFCPAGMGGKHKKLQDFLVDVKVPRRLRDRVPLIAAGDDILWVAGYRTDERFLPGSDTERLLLIGIRQVGKGSAS